MKRSTLARALFLVIFATAGIALEAQTSAERVEALRAELDRVSREIRRVEIYSRPEWRAEIAQEVARLENEREKLLHIMPEMVDEETFIGDLRELADRWTIRIEPGDVVFTDHDGYRTISTSMMVEGDAESIEFFSSRYSLTSAVRKMRELEGVAGRRVFEATAYMIPAATTELSRCTIPKRTDDAAGPETALRDHLITQCASLMRADPELRRALERKQYLEDWISLVAQLKIETREPSIEEDLEELNELLDLLGDENDGD